MAAVLWRGCLRPVVRQCRQRHHQPQIFRASAVVHVVKQRGASQHQRAVMRNEVAHTLPAQSQRVLVQPLLALQQREVRGLCM